MENLKKFGMAEIIIGTSFTLAVDGIAALLDMTGIGYLLATPLQAIMSLITSWWLKTKGGRAFKMKKQFIKQISNVLPIVPTTTLSFIIEVKIHNKKIS